MIELINIAPQTVAAGQSVVFNNTVVHSGCAERHRAGSSQVTLAGKGRYRVAFSGNIAIPTGGTVEEISLGIALNGEVLSGSLMRVTPAAVDNYFNVATQILVDVDCGCCVTVAVSNPTAQAILADNPNLTAVRVC